MDELEDMWANEAFGKYRKRSGIRRIYCFKSGEFRSRGRLELEVVLRGYVFFRIPLWSIKPLLDDEI